MLGRPASRLYLRRSKLGNVLHIVHLTVTCQVVLITDETSPRNKVRLKMNNALGRPVISGLQRRRWDSRRTCVAMFPCMPGLRNPGAVYEIDAHIALRRFCDDSLDVLESHLNILARNVCRSARIGQYTWILPFIQGPLGKTIIENASGRSALPSMGRTNVVVQVRHRT